MGLATKMDYSERTEMNMVAVIVGIGSIVFGLLLFVFLWWYCSKRFFRLFPVEPQQDVELGEMSPDSDGEGSSSSSGADGEGSSSSSGADGEGSSSEDT